MAEIDTWFEGGEHMSDDAFRGMLSVLETKGNIHIEANTADESVEAVKERAVREGFPHGFAIPTDPRLAFFIRMAMQPNTFKPWAVFPFTTRSQLPVTPAFGQGTEVDFANKVWIAFSTEKDAIFAKMFV